jgi:hypothetical protein
MGIKPQPASRPILAAVQGQQKHIEALKQVAANQRHEIEVLKGQLTYIANMAGVGQQMTAIRKRADQLKLADVNNPGQPVPDPPSQGPSETTEEAVTPETMDDPRRPGQTPGSVQDVPADTTDLAMNPGESLPTSPYGDMVDVTAPVAGTETHVPDDQTRIETDVRVGDPMNLDTAFPWTISPNNSNGQAPGSGEMAGQKAGAKTARSFEDVRRHLNDIDPDAGSTQPTPADRENFHSYVKSNFPEHYNSYFQPHHDNDNYRPYEEHEGHRGDEGGYYGSKKVAAKQPQPSGASRTILAIKLARLRVQAGIAQGDDLAVAGVIEASKMPDDAISHEIATLAQVQKAASRQRPAGLVPKSASAQGNRSLPSLASGASAFSAPSTYDDIADSDLFG